MDKHDGGKVREEQSKQPTSLHLHLCSEVLLCISMQIPDSSLCILYVLLLFSVKSNQ